MIRVKRTGHKNWPTEGARRAVEEGQGLKCGPSGPAHLPAGVAGPVLSLGAEASRSVGLRPHLVILDQ